MSVNKENPCKSLVRIQFQGENMERKPLRRLIIERICSELVYNSTCCITASEANNNTVPAGIVSAD